MKRITGLYPLGALLCIHIFLCGMIVFTDIGRGFIIIILFCMLFMIFLIPAVFYFAGKWTEKLETHTRSQRFMIAFGSGCLYSITLPFLMNLDQFSKWGHWKSFLITLSIENILYLAIPFLLVFIPCWIGQEVQSKMKHQKS